MDYSFKNRVKRQPKALDLTQPELARQAGCSVAAIVKIEAGDRCPSCQIPELLAQFVEIPIARKLVVIW